jgi:glutamate carboxypeptidase
MVKTIAGMLALCGLANIAADARTTSYDILKLAKAEQPAAMKTWKALVNVDSGTGYKQGLTHIEALLVEQLKYLGAAVKAISASPSVGDNIIGTFSGTGDKRILLMIHYDTVFPPGEAKRRPFHMQGDRVYGPGVADAKGGAVIILHAIQMLEDLNFDGYGKLTVLFNPDEETGSFGSRDLIKKLASRSDYVLSYEPPDRQGVTVQTNGITQLMLKVIGRASHAGQAPEEGRNAAIEIAHQLLQLNQLGDPDKGTTVNWTIVRAGNKTNIIPALATAEADMRYTDLTETKRVLRDARRIVQDHLIPNTKVEVNIARSRPPLLRNSASLKLAALARKIYQDIGRELDPITMRFGTDAGYAYQADGTRPAVLETLGIVGGGLHSLQEFAKVSSLAPRLYLTTRMIIALSRND